MSKEASTWPQTKRGSKPALVYALLTLYTLSPLLCVLLSLGIARLFGCPLDESGTQPCRAFGQDIGGFLVALFVTGWLFFITLPTGSIAVLLYSVFLLRAKSLAKRNR